MPVSRPRPRTGPAGRRSRRERAREESTAEAVSAADSDVRQWSDPGPPETPVAIAVSLVPVRPFTAPLDDESDRALLSAVNNLLGTGWTLHTDPDVTRLRRGEAEWDEWLSFVRSGRLKLRFLMEQPGSRLDPFWAINALDLASHIVRCLLVGFRMAEIDGRLDGAPWGAAATFNGFAERRVFFIDADRYVGPRLRDLYPSLIRDGVLTEPADAVGIAAQLVADLARVHDVSGHSTWVAGLGPRLLLHDEQLRHWKGRLGA